MKTLFSIFPVILSVSSAFPSVLSDSAAKMKPGEWRMMYTQNIQGAIGSADVGGGASGGIVGYADKMVWDPTSERVFFVSSDHNFSAEALKFVSFNSSTNAWEVMPRLPWSSSGSHGYHHNAIDEARGVFYMRETYTSRNYWRYNIASRQWSVLPANNTMLYFSCCAGVAYFPGLGLTWVQGNETTSGGGVTRFDEASGQWVRVALDLPMGGLSQFAEYSPVHKVMIFGGGGSSSLHKLDASGKVTTLGNAPITLGSSGTPGHSIVTLDPVSGDFLIFGSDGSFYVYDVVADTWEKQPGGNYFDPILSGSANGHVWQVAATPVSNYGVTFFAKFNYNYSAVYLYKHSAPAAGVEARNRGVSSIIACPNPFRVSTTIRAPCSSWLKVFDLRGREVADVRGNGVWKPKGLPSGVYIAKVVAGGRQFNRTLLYQK